MMANVLIVDTNPRRKSFNPLKLDLEPRRDRSPVVTRAGQDMVRCFRPTKFESLEKSSASTSSITHGRI